MRVCEAVSYPGMYWQENIFVSQFTQQLLPHIHTHTWGIHRALPHKLSCLNLPLLGSVMGGGPPAASSLLGHSSGKHHTMHHWLSK